MPFLASNINKGKYSCFWVTEILTKQENWHLSNKVTFLSILLSSFDFLEKKFWGRICYIIINFFEKFFSKKLKLLHVYQIGHFLDVHNLAYVFWKCPYKLTRTICKNTFRKNTCSWHMVVAQYTSSSLNLN